MISASLIPLFSSSSISRLRILEIQPTFHVDRRHVLHSLSIVLNEFDVLELQARQVVVVRAVDAEEYRWTSTGWTQRERVARCRRNHAAHGRNEI